MTGITLIAVLCLAGSLPSPATCVAEVVTDSRLTPNMSADDCLGIGAFIHADKYRKAHPLYRSPEWVLSGIGCQEGLLPARDV